MELETAAAQRRHRSLRNGLLKPPSGSPRIIAEIKRASPSAGMLRPDLSPVELALDYQRNGAAAISILSEPRYFLGSTDDIKIIRAATTLPLLRKDFIFEEYQVLETAAVGADVLLLIVAVLERRQLHDLVQAAVAYGLETLIETHDANELEIALEHPAALIGVNNRNLKTLATDPAVARRLAAIIPPERIAVAESGIRSANEIRELQSLGYDAFLIGETLLKQGNPGENLQSLLA